MVCTQVREIHCHLSACQLHTRQQRCSVRHFLTQVALHWAVGQIALGAIDTVPQNSAERLIWVMATLVGFIFGSTLVSSLSAAMINFQMSKKDADRGAAGNALDNLGVMGLFGRLGLCVDSWRRESHGTAAAQASGSHHQSRVRLVLCAWLHIRRSVLCRAV